MRISSRVIQSLLILPVFFLASCSGTAGLKMHQVPENGYKQTLNYQFQAQVHADEDGQCQKMVIRVKPLNKVYWKTPPPQRLQIFDDDCMAPIRFERLQYLARTGGMVRLNGIELSRFWSEQFRLEDELIGWLWREGII